MALTIDDIRAYIAEGNIEPEIKNIIYTGFLENMDLAKEEFLVCHGTDFVRANQCDKLWGEFNLELIEFIKQKYSDEEIDEIAEVIQIDDMHWQWLAKTCNYMGDEYEWFFLVIDNLPQAVCLIYHPKKSAVETGDIFYIEYIAVAPWNRNNPMNSRKYYGAGQAILKCTIEYATQKLRLRFGFSLHSLPKAEGFYQKIGMTYFEPSNKDTLNYYEMKEADAKTYMGVTENDDS